MPSSHATRDTQPQRPYGLWLLYGFTAVSLGGFGIFGLHPERLATLDAAAIRFYSVSFRFFAMGQVWLAGAVMLLFLKRHAGWKWIGAFAALYLISLTSELLGTGYGIPFGAYSYSAVLKPMWLGRVPLGIPLSWFYMSLPAYAFALSVIPARNAWQKRVTLASFILLAWDLALDPAMSNATRYWEWGEHGPYYGMPLLNLFGWYLTGIVLMGALHLLRAESWIRELPLGWLKGFYGANLLLAIGICAAAGLWIAVAFTAAALAATAIIATLVSAYGTAHQSEPLIRLM